LPVEQTMAVVFASPHSGADYPRDFLAASRLNLLTLRRAEDCFVDELFADAPIMGAPLLRARFPRAYIDPNREPYELDPAMFAEPLPAYANTTSPRVVAGLGTIARLVGNGEEIYAGKLNFAEVRGRLERCYRPYHKTLRDLVERTKRRFGFCVLIDCHSMPSVGAPMERDAGRERVDFVLGDRYANSCGRLIVERVEGTLRDLGYAVARNHPYSGGYVTEHYGRPAEGVHALQIEINRGLYMDELAIRRAPGFAGLRQRLSSLIAELTSIGDEVMAA
jgi:N-formylglutamate amidohydrolase